MPGVRSIVKRTAATVDRFVPPPAGVTILIYHRVGGGTDSEVDLPVDEFEHQLEHLAEHHRVISLDDAAAELTVGTPTGWATNTVDAGDASTEAPDDGRRSVVITFDDGTDEFTEHPVPALQRHELPATLYVAT